ncbi:MAG: hypothetical protein IPM55_09250 [Acidobacteria bacterium]|nr:hypothetical protein [Acidobacteriota bacterium]
MERPQRRQRLAHIRGRMLYLLGEKQLVGLAEANPKAYVEKGRFPINDRGWDSWAHPVVIGGKLYIRNQNELACYDVKAK